MSRPRARPRFTLELPLSPDEVTARVRAHLERNPGKVTGSVHRRTVLLTVRPEDIHFWSPQLDVQLEEGSNGGTLLAGLFSPQPHIWTAFLGVQLLFGLLSIAAGIWVTCMLMLGRDPWLALGLLGVMLIGGGLAFGGAYVGQGIGTEQMYELRAFLDTALRDGCSEKHHAASSDESPA